MDRDLVAGRVKKRLAVNCPVELSVSLDNTHNRSVALVSLLSVHTVCDDSGGTVRESDCVTIVTRSDRSDVDITLDCSHNRLHSRYSYLIDLVDGFFKGVNSHNKVIKLFVKIIVVSATASKSQCRGHSGSHQSFNCLHIMTVLWFYFTTILFPSK